MDAFGQAALDFLEGISDEFIYVKSETMEDDVIPVKHLFRTFNQMPQCEQIALQNAKGKVLDVGGGVGSHCLYLQNKGKAENFIINLGFNFTAIIQPSLLLGSRAELRIGEIIAQFIFKKLSFIFVGKLRPFKAIKAENVAKAIIKIIKENKKNIYFTSDKLEYLSKVKKNN